MTQSSLTRWPAPSQFDGPAQPYGEAAGGLVTLANGPDDSFEGILHFPVRWDAVSKASHLKADTGLLWEVQYRADTDRFRVVLNDDSLRFVRAAASLDTNGSSCQAVGQHRYDTA